MHSRRRTENFEYLRGNKDPMEGLSLTAEKAIAQKKNEDACHHILFVNHSECEYFISKTVNVDEVLGAYRSWFTGGAGHDIPMSITDTVTAENSQSVGLIILPGDAVVQGNPVFDRLEELHKAGWTSLSQTRVQNRMRDKHAILYRITDTVTGLARCTLSAKDIAVTRAQAHIISTAKNTMHNAIIGVQVRKHPYAEVLKAELREIASRMCMSAETTTMEVVQRDICVTDVANRGITMHANHKLLDEWLNSEYVAHLLKKHINPNITRRIENEKARKHHPNHAQLSGGIGTHHSHTHNESSRVRSEHRSGAA